MRNLKQSTATNIMVLMVDSTDHVTGKTGLTLTITASKNGAAFATITPTVTERGNGWYELALTTGHTDTLGDLAYHVTSSGADPADWTDRVVAYDPADAGSLGLSALAVINVAKWGGNFVATDGSGFPSVNTTHWGGSAVGGMPAAQADVQTAMTAQGYTTTRAGYLDTLNGLVQAVWDKATSAITTAGSVGKRIVDFLTGDAFARLGAPAGASTSADVAAIKSELDATKAKTDLIGTNTGDSPNAVTTQGRVDVAVSSRPSAAQIDTQLSGTHGSGAWGGGASVTLTPILVQANNPRFSTKDVPPIPAGSEPSDAFVVVDANNAPIDLSAKTVRLVAYVDNAGDPDNPFDDTVSAVFKYETGGNGITIGGTGNNVVTVKHSAANAGTVRDLRYMLWNVTDKLVLATGKLPIIPAVMNT